MTRFKRLKRAGWILFTVLLVLGLWAFWWEPSRFIVVHETIPIRPWHVEHSGMKFAVISDLHVGSPFRDLTKLREIVEAINRETPDIVVILGDTVVQGVIGGKFIEPEPIADELSGLRAPLGVVAVLGNHDWWYDGKRVRKALESRGIRVLDNENLSVNYRDQSFWLCGLEDLITRGSRLQQTLAQIHDDNPVIVLMHNPDVFPEMPKRVSLSLAGHTHGGQVRFPIIGRPIVPSKFGQRYAYGLIEEDGKKLFVTAGVGTSIIPVRFRQPGEIVILTLVQASEKP